MAEQKKAKKNPEVTLDPDNLRIHRDSGREAAGMSLQELGAGRSIVVDKTGRIIGGNEIMEEAKNLGLPLRFVHTDGTELVVVKRTDLSTTDMKRIALAIADNRIAEHSDWDYDALPKALTQLAGAGLDIEATGFNEIDLAELSEQETSDGPEDGGGSGGGGSVPKRFEVYLTFDSQLDAESWLANNGYPDHNFGVGKGVVIAI